MKKKSKYNVAIMGATGAVGEEMLKILEERNFPVDRLALLASSRSAGKKYKFKGRELFVEELKENSFKGIDIVLASAGGSISKKFAPFAIKEGAVMIDNTSAFRMDRAVPLVIPEINPQDIKKHKGIIANPNCSTIIMLVPIFPIHQKNRIKRILVSTYQAASGAGAKAMRELEDQSRDVLAGLPAKKIVFPHQIAFNLFSHNSTIKEDGYNEEEIKMIKETKKIFHGEKIKITATAVRVPVFRAHSETIYLELSNEPNLDEIRKILSKAPGVKIVDDREKNYFPMPLEATGRDEVFVGRLRKDISSPKGLCLFVAGDQLRKGAALNAIQIAEILIS
ncbi:MAG: aspartate-semialdehyde dehydrogenase [Candidatus Omnitrophica bacterium CG1_02_46_14]|nr:MAG: aspartate-semialdehyde dehydrogenase [Candidatus Omnitrophica bacterium CG1_02_46_14]